MSTDSSDARRRWWRRWQTLSTGTGASFVAFLLPQWLAGELAPVLLPVLPYSANLKVFFFYVLVEFMTIGLIALLVRLMNLRLQDIGLGKTKLEYVGKGVLGYAAYFALVLMVMSLARLMGLSLEEDQPLGFSHPEVTEQILILALFGAIVPLTEELLFRGLLFTSLRSRLPFVATTLIVSVLFALVHGQLLVGIDVFVLSLVLCYLREKTGSIWPAVIAHGLKNSVAFFILFIYNGT